VIFTSYWIELKCGLQYATIVISMTTKNKNRRKIEILSDPVPTAETVVYMYGKPNIQE